MDLPVACNLGEPEFRERRNGLMMTIKIGIVETHELNDGYAFRFPSDGAWIVQLAEMIRIERTCCPFMSFDLNVEPGNGSIWLRIAGPDGTKEFLNSLFE